MIRTEEHRRLNTDLHPAKEQDLNVLSKLRLEEFLHLRKNYIAYTPHVRILFCAMAMLVVLWDVMLIATALYFHIMIEKVVATCAAVLIWFVLYRVIYVNPWSPGLPGEGPFKYITCRAKANVSKRRKVPKDNAGSTQSGAAGKWSAKDDVPKFMGMPIYPTQTQPGKAEPEPEFDASDVGGRRRSIETGAAIVVRPLRRARSRSASANRLGSKSVLNSKYL